MKKIILLIVIASASFLIYSGLNDPLIENDKKEEDIKNENGIEDVEPGEEIKGEVAIIIDDLGYNPELNNELLKIKQPLTVAILPFLKNTEKAINDFGGVDNFELILHMPFEPISDKHFEDKMIMTDHSEEEMDELLTEALSEMDNRVAGVNNHKGSKFTSDEEKMRQFLELIKENNLFFVDSFTINTSVGYDLAKELGVLTAKRDIFLDYVDDKEEIRNRLHELEELALEKGSAIAIGHHKKNTLEVLREELPKMKDRGIRLIKVSELLN